MNHHHHPKNWKPVFRTGEHPESFDLHFRGMMLVRIAISFAALLFLGTLVRHLASPMPTRILLTNGAIGTLFATVPLLRKRHPGFMIWTFLAGFSVLIANGGLVAGGINAPICVLLPLMPITGYCFGGTRIGTSALVLSITLTIGLLIVTRYGWSDTVLDPDSIGVQRMTVLVVVLIASYAIGYVYETIRKQNEQRIVEYSRLASLGTMAGGIAHEINNPLAILMGYAEQLDYSARLGKFEPEKQITISEKIKLTCTRIANVVSALRSYARDEDAAPTKALALTEITRSALTFSQERFTSSGIEVRTGDLFDRENHLITALKNQALEVILEILNNAYLAALEDGDAGTARWISLRASKSDDYIDLRIANSGPQIADQIRSKIFVPFFTTRDVGKGTGLGLSLCASNMHRMGGDIFLDPEAENTTFVIRFRKASTAQSAAKGQAAS
jgi:signal transduction histidine kinase